MTLAEVVFWACVGLVGYTYAVYPLILAVLARRRPGRTVGVGEAPGGDTPISVIVAAHNEDWCIGRRVAELAEIVASRPAGGELIVVSDGSTDQTVEAARAAESLAMANAGSAGNCPISVVELSSNEGKAVALNRGCSSAVHPILVLADARQTWARDAIDRLVANFIDPAVGAVSGDLVLESAAGVMAGVGLYWRFEKWLRQAESAVYSMVSVTGSICALRRELFRPIPPGTVLDDCYWPLEVVMQGYRVIHEPRALAYDRLPEHARDEFRRKVRTLAGNFQLMARLPSVLSLSRNPIWWQFVSHKALRLAVPWALLLMLLTSGALAGPLYRVAFSCQVAFWCLGVAGLWPNVAARWRVASTAASFLVLNAAAWLAFWVWISGSTTRSWSKVKYRSDSAATPDRGPCTPQAAQGS
jgi:cellulose synthase/poly-beta-1,6-N-acetylglucosamine synthase-like glycosyltransferase